MAILHLISYPKFKFFHLCNVKYTLHNIGRCFGSGRDDSLKTFKNIEEILHVKQDKDVGRNISSSAFHDPVNVHKKNVEIEKKLLNGSVYHRLKSLQQSRNMLLSTSFRYDERTEKSSDQSNKSAELNSDDPSDEERKRILKRNLAATFIGIVSSGIILKLILNNSFSESTPKETLKQLPKRVPESSSLIPDEVSYLLIGGGTASFAAFRAIKTLDPTAKILVVSNEPYNPYMRPPLSKEMFYLDDKSYTENMKFKQWNGTIRSVFYEPNEFYIPCELLNESENGGIAVAQGWSVKALDPDRNIVYLNDGKKIKYHKCLLATGSRPKIPKVFKKVAQSEKINLFRGIDDFKKLENVIQNGSSIIVVGNGFLGSELACAVAKKGRGEQISVTQVFREETVMSKVLPSYLCKWTMGKIADEGVKIKPRSLINNVIEKNGRIELVLDDGDIMVADQVVVATGAEPVIDLASSANLELDQNQGGFLVNTELSARSDLYAAGDCACFYDIDLGRRRIEHHDHAVISGRLAGENMCGAHKPYVHQPMFWSDLGSDIGFEAIGIIDSTLPTVGVYAKKDADDSLQMSVPEHSSESPKDMTSKRDDEYEKGVLFYLKDGIIVGIVLWNLFNKMEIARLLLKEKRKFEDMNEVAKLFNIHGLKDDELNSTEAAVGNS